MGRLIFNGFVVGKSFSSCSNYTFLQLFNPLELWSSTFFSFKTLRVCTPPPLVISNNCIVSFEEFNTRIDFFSRQVVEIVWIISLKLSVILAELSLANSATAHLKHKALIVVRLEGILIQDDDLHIK